MLNTQGKLFQLNEKLCRIPTFLDVSLAVVIDLIALLRDHAVLGVSDPLIHILEVDLFVVCNGIIIKNRSYFARELSKLVLSAISRSRFHSASDSSNLLKIVNV